MAKYTNTAQPSFGKIKTATELGKIIRAFRRSHNFTLEKVSGISNLSMRFLSELERGKDTAELGKVLQTLTTLGLDVIIQPRGAKNNYTNNHD